MILRFFDAKPVQTSLVILVTGVTFHEILLANKLMGHENLEYSLMHVPNLLH